MTLAWHDRSDRMRMTFAGTGAKAALGGLLTNDIAALGPFAGQYAAALTPKGKVLALCRVFDRGTDLLVDADAAAAAGFTTMIRKFVNPRLARYAVVTPESGCLAVRGDAAARATAAALGSLDAAPALEGLVPLGGLTIGASDDAVHVVRATDHRSPGFDLFASATRIAVVREALRAAGIAEAPATAVEADRIARGMPRWGVDMDAETLPQEALLDALGAISFNKGCYTGQEVVARIHFRGHVNRQLRWLASTQPLRPGMRVLDAAGGEVGDVRSVTDAAGRGPLAIAMVRRELSPGSVVTARDDRGAVAATVEPITY